MEMYVDVLNWVFYFSLILVLEKQFLNHLHISYYFRIFPVMVIFPNKK